MVTRFIPKDTGTQVNTNLLGVQIVLEEPPVEAITVDYSYDVVTVVSPSDPETGLPQYICFSTYLYERYSKEDTEVDGTDYYAWVYYDKITSDTPDPASDSEVVYTTSETPYWRPDTSQITSNDRIYTYDGVSMTVISRVLSVPYLYCDMMVWRPDQVLDENGNPYGLLTWASGNQYVCRANKPGAVIGFVDKVSTETYLEAKFNKSDTSLFEGKTQWYETWESPDDPIWPGTPQNPKVIGSSAGGVLVWTDNGEPAVGDVVYFSSDYPDFNQQAVEDVYPQKFQDPPIEPLIYGIKLASPGYVYTEYNASDSSNNKKLMNGSLNFEEDNVSYSAPIVFVYVGNVVTDDGVDYYSWQIFDFNTDEYGSYFSIGDEYYTAGDATTVGEEDTIYLIDDSNGISIDNAGQVDNVMSWTDEDLLVMCVNQQGYNVVQKYSRDYRWIVVPNKATGCEYIYEEGEYGVPDGRPLALVYEETQETVGGSNYVFYKQDTSIWQGMVQWGGPGTESYCPVWTNSERPEIGDTVYYSMLDPTFNQFEVGGLVEQDIPEPEPVEPYVPDEPNCTVSYSVTGKDDTWTDCEDKLTDLNNVIANIPRYMFLKFSQDVIITEE